MDQIDEMIHLWNEWLDNNPKADTHQRYYAAGVIDGLFYAKDPEQFKERWEYVLLAGG